LGEETEGAFRVTAQSELDFDRLAGEGPNVSRFQVDTMIAALRNKGWQTAKALGARKEGEKRFLRAIAESSEGQIISGQKGYKLTLEATLEEIAATAWMKSQAKKMLHRWISIQRVAHPTIAAAKTMISFEP
jgi:hypothetical protein